MKRERIWIPIAALIVFVTIFAPNGSTGKEIVRPEEIKSRRQVNYCDETYVKLARLWKEYFDKYPSEYAYANWMYAARYAGDKKYPELLTKGLRKYPTNPTLLYLKALENLGAHNDVEGRKYLERAIALDPDYVDAWFVLVLHYMDAGDEERLDLALRHLLESGVINDEVMDYNYNMLVSLDDDAILITNGDNDTYPGWILTRILKVRPDVTIVNRSLLNSAWYPMYVIEHGLPRFIGKNELDDLRNSVLRESKDKNANPSPGGPFGDTLILKIIESAKRAGRPVYLSRTVYVTDKLKDVTEKGRELGLVTLVTPSQVPYAEQLRKVYRKWVETFRTGGLESWRLKNAPPKDAGRMLLLNYAAADDVVQETFVRALGASVKHSTGTVQGFLGTIAYRLALKEAKRTRRNVKLDGLDLPDRGNDALDSILNDERDRLVAKAIETLDAEHRDVLVLRFYGGHSYEGIASILQAPLGTVKSRIFYAVKSCRQILRQKGVLE